MTVVAALTPTQRAVVDELARDGADNATIAARLHLSQSTVAAYIHRALEVTGCPTRTALAVGVLRDTVRIDDART